MTHDREEFKGFIANTFEEIYANKRGENELLMYQIWSHSVHERATFIKLFIDEKSNWKIHTIVWEMGKDTSRLLDPMEKIKWKGQVSPSIKRESQLLAHEKKQALKELIEELKREELKEFKKGYLKKLKIRIPNGTKSFAWNAELESTHVVARLVRELERKTEME